MKRDQKADSASTPDCPARLSRTLATGLCIALATTTLTAGCASTQYAPQVVARGELTLRYDDGFQIYAGQKKLTSGLTYPRLAQHVRCVPQAQEHARRARSNGQGAIATAVLGGVLGASGLIGLVGLADQDRLGLWLGGSFALSTIGLTFSIVSWRLKNHANGNALDAVNFYNDSVGSLGATCDDLSYPPPAGPPAPEATALPGAMDPGSLPAPPMAPPDT